MRMIVSVALDAAEIPQEYRPLMVDFMVAAFKRCGVVAGYEKYFAEGCQPYGFSVYLPKSKFEKTILLDSPKFKIIFASYLETCYGDFFGMFQKVLGETFEIAGNRWRVKSVLPVAEKEIVGEQARIRMMSPLVVARYDDMGDKKPHLLGMRDIGFEKHFADAVQRQIEGLGLSKTVSSAIKIEQCKDGNQSKEVHVLHGGRYVRSTVGDLMLIGSGELLNTLYQCGIGEYRDKGFGLFEIV